MLRIAGVPISDRDGRDLVTSLVSDNAPRALALANRIQTCIELGNVKVALDAQERTTLLAVLEDPPETLAELRGVLARDNRAR